MKSLAQTLLILSVGVSGGCGNKTVDLGRGDSSGWTDTPVSSTSRTQPQTIYASTTDYVFGLGLNDTTLFALVSHEHDFELVACPVSRCGNERSVLYRGPPFGQESGAVLTPIVIVRDWLFWMVGNGSPAGIAACPIAGCEVPTFITSELDAGRFGALAGDAEHVYWFDSERSLMQLSPGDSKPSLVRSFAGEHRQTANLVVRGDFVHYTVWGGNTIYRARKDGSGSAEAIAKDDNLAGFDVDGDALYYTTQSLTGSVVCCPVAGTACGEDALVSNQRWPSGVRAVNGELFWVAGIPAGRLSRSDSGHGALMSCDLPACANRHELVHEFNSGSLLDESGVRIGPASFAVNRDFIIWNDQRSGLPVSMRSVGR